MIVITEDGTRHKGVSTFWEYEYVKEHTRDLDRLKKLYDTRLTHQQTIDLLDHLCLHYKLRPLPIRWTGRTDRGYYSYEGWIRLRSSDYISTEVAIHELAHHWVYSKLNVEGHGWDFVARLDQLAETAEKVLA